MEQHSGQTRSGYGDNIAPRVDFASDRFGGAPLPPTYTGGYAATGMDVYYSQVLIKYLLYSLCPETCCYLTQSCSVQATGIRMILLWHPAETESRNYIRIGGHDSFFPLPPDKMDSSRNLEYKFQTWTKKSFELNRLTQVGFFGHLPLHTLCGSA